MNCTLCNRPDTSHPYCLDCWNALGICKVVDNLYITDDKTARQYDKLRSLKISQILTVGSELPLHDTTEFKTMHISIDDDPKENIADWFNIAHRFIQDGSTLVHCYAGISRSATIVISYLMCMHKMPIHVALNHCVKCRPVIAPNRGFMRQLLKYHRELRKTRG